jgi:peptidyl-tRNA hydrolase
MAKSPTYTKVVHNGIKISVWHNDHGIRARVGVKHPQYQTIHVLYVVDHLHMGDPTILQI